MRKILTHGTFDTPHIGHAIFLSRAALLGELHVGICTDEYALSQGKKTVFNFHDRVEFICQLPFVKETYPVNKASMREAIETIKPDIIVIGSDWVDRYYEQIDCDPRWLSRMGCQLIYLPYTRGISTTEIKRRLK